MKKLNLLIAAFFLCLQFVYSQAGKLDPSFGNNGIVSADLGEKSLFTRTVKKVLPLPNGSIYVVLDVAGKTLITKTLSDGSVDSSFGSNGYSSMASIATADAAIQNDGKIVIAGNSNNVFGVARYNKDGSTDNSFSPEELIMQYEHQVNRISAFTLVAIQNDGKIVLGGFAGLDEDNSSTIIARLNTDGKVDQTFGFEGVVNEGTAEATRPYSIASQNDGKILVASSSFFGRYNTDGSRDSSFNRKVLENTDFSIFLVKIQSDGKIVASGSGNIVRYNTDGSLDKSFSDDGKLQIQTGNIAAIDDNNKIIVTASSSITRYNTSGTLDLTFNKNGSRTTNFDINSVAVQSNGKIVAAGLFNGSNGSDLLGVRYNTNGSIDLTYGEAGKLLRKLIGNIEAGNTTYTCTAIQKDGKVVAAGTTNFDFIITRYNTDGSLDNSFNGSGKQTLADYPGSVFIQNDGKIVVGGTSSLVRYNTNGSLDNTFNHSGRVSLPGSPVVANIILQNDGRIVVSGSAILRYNADGSLDNTFNKKGILTPPLDVRRAAIQSDGKIVISGIFNDNFAIARLNTDGSLDNSFSDDGIQTIEFTDYEDNHVHSEASLVAVQTDGKIVVSGSGIERGRFYAEYTRYFIKRFNEDGTPEPYFYPGTPTDMVTADSEIVVSEVHVIYPFPNDESADTAFKEIQTAYDINSIAVTNNRLYAVGGTGTVGIVAKYLLDGKTQTPPTVNLTTPANNTTHLAPANIRLSAAASDADGTISKVEFYNGTHLLHTETIIPYGFKWRNVPVGNYTITAKAYDNSGLITTSTPVHVSVVPNKPPIVIITKPVIKQTVAAPGYIHLEADAKDVDGRIARVEFYNGSTLIRTEYEAPYTYHWENVPRGIYTITAVAVDNWAARTTSTPVTVRVVNPPVTITNKPSAENDKTNLNDLISINLAPNPVTNIVNIYTKGLKQNKQATISVMSASGVELKTMQTNSSTKSVQLDVSSFVNGTYMIKLKIGNTILYKQFVKL